MSKKSWFKKESKAESPKERTMDEIKKEYEQICGYAGDLQFKMLADKAKLDNYNQQLVHLHNDYNKAQAKAAAVEAAKPENKPSTDPLKKA